MLFAAAQFLRIFQAQFASDLIAIFLHRIPVCPRRLGDGAFAGNLWMLPHIGGDGFLLLLADCIQKDVDVRLGITVCDAAEGDCNSRVCLSPALTARTPERIR